MLGVVAEAVVTAPLLVAIDEIVAKEVEVVVGDVVAGKNVDMDFVVVVLEMVNVLVLVAPAPLLAVLRDVEFGGFVAGTVDLYSNAFSTLQDDETAGVQ